MKKFKKLSVLLAGAMMLSCVSIMPVSAAEPAASNKTLFSQDFEGDNVNPKNIAGSGATNFTTNTYSEGGTYGSFTNDQMYRPGYDFSKDDVTSGKIKVSLDFHPVFVDGKAVQGGVVIGNSYAVSGLQKKQTLSLLWINSTGKMSTAGRLGSSSVKGKDLGIEAKDVWYTCEATLDLDTQSIDITVTDKEAGDSVGTYSGSVRQRIDGENEWEEWPIADTPFKNIAFIYKLDVDNILVEQIVEEPTPPPAEDVTATAKISADNGEGSYSVGLKFDQALNPSTYKNIVFKIGDEIRGGAVDDVLGHIDGEALIAIILENATSREAEVKFTNKDITID